MTPRKPTADERDRKGRTFDSWWSDNYDGQYGPCDGEDALLLKRWCQSAYSAGRILNRIVREEAKRGK